MQQFVVPIGSILVAWACLSTLYAGIGVLLVRVIGCKLDKSVSLPACLWIGWGACISFLQVWHLFLPVNHIALLSLIPVSLAGFLWTAKELRALIQANVPSTKLLGVQVTAAIWLAYHAACQPGNFDSGLYHVTLIKWFTNYPIVPGLGNLHDRLAFNCSYFLYPSMLNVGPFVDKYHQLASSLLILWALFKSFSGWSRMIKRTPVLVSDVLDALFLVPILNLAVGQTTISSPTPDVAVFLLGFVIGSDLLKLASIDISPVSGDSLNAFRFTVFSIVFLSIIGVVVKLNFTVFGFLSILFATLLFLKKLPYRQHRWLLLCTCFFAIVTMMSWALRGIILGGYPAFPSTGGAVNVDWRIPLQAAQHLKILEAWARHPGPDWRSALSGWGWIKEWTVRTFQDSDVTLPIGLLIGLGAFVPFVLRERRGGNLVVQSLILTVPLAAIIVWFFSAPDPRFLGASLWFLSFVLMAIVLHRTPRTMTFPILLLSTALLFAGRISLALFLRSPQYDPGPLRSAPTITKTTNSGLDIHVPVEGQNQQCWNAPLPCTPYFNPALRLREPGNLAQGFRVEE